MNYLGIRYKVFRKRISLLTFGFSPNAEEGENGDRYILKKEIFISNGLNADYFS